MRHKIIVELPDSGPVTLVEPFEVGGLGAEIFSHITLVCRRLAPVPAGELEALRNALYTGPLWGGQQSAAPVPVAFAGQISHLRLLAEQPDGEWAPTYDFELGR